MSENAPIGLYICIFGYQLVNCATGAHQAVLFSVPMFVDQTHALPQLLLLHWTCCLAPHRDGPGLTF